MNKHRHIEVDSESQTPRHSPDTPDRRIEIGEIKSAYGVKGWVKVFSYTRPIEQIFSYRSWQLGDNYVECRLEDYDRRSNNGLIAKIEGIDDRTAALDLAGQTIAIYQSELEQLDEGYYWSEIIGLDVFNSTGERLGQVSEMIETGANDVMVVNAVNHEHLIPYAGTIVKQVELEAGRIIVDWESDY